MDQKLRTYEALEKRFFDRVDLNVPVAYELADRDQRVTGRGVAHVVNLSQGGVMIRGRQFLEAHYIRLLIPVHGENDLAILGKIVHCASNGRNRYQTGIHFIEGPTKMRRVSVALVRAYNLQKHAGAE
jgi:hypothetical protein